MTRDLLFASLVTGVLVYYAVTENSRQHAIDVAAEEHYGSTVLTRLRGRLGNQMFQYASSLGIAKARGAKRVCLDTCTDASYMGNWKSHLDQVFVGPFDINFHDVHDTVRNSNEKGYATFQRWDKFPDQSIELSNVYLQSWRYFDGLEDTVRQALKFRPEIISSAEKIVSDAREGGKAVVGIHIRRGDHLTEGYLRSPDLDYYKRAKEMFRSAYNGNVHFLAVSDDHQWVKDNLAASDLTVVSGPTRLPQDDMAVLSVCDGTIISLGTFSWWCAWLCKGPVIYNSDEFIMSHRNNRGKVVKSDYFLPSWIGI